jgi:hypothetical protein
MRASRIKRLERRVFFRLFDERRGVRVYRNARRSMGNSAVFRGFFIEIEICFIRAQ